MKEYDPDKVNIPESNVYDKKWTKYVANKLHACIYLENAGQSKYGTVLKTLN